MQILLHQPEVVKDRETIIKQLSLQVPGFKNDCMDRTIDSHVSLIRKQIKTVTGSAEVAKLAIKTVHGRGFRVWSRKDFKTE